MAAGAGPEGVSCEALPFTGITGTVVLKVSSASFRRPRQVCGPGRAAPWESRGPPPRGPGALSPAAPAASLCPLPAGPLPA